MELEFYVPSIRDAEMITNALQGNQKKCCEMSMANTILWAKHYQTEIAFWNNQIIYRSKLQTGDYSYCADFSNMENGKAVFDLIYQLAKQEQSGFRLHCITPVEWENIQQWYPNQFEITFDRDSADYIYGREKLATLAGRKLHGKRNHIHRFEEANPDWRYESISDENEEACAKMAMLWCMDNCMANDATIEFDKIDESKLVVYAIRHRKELGLIGGALLAGDRVIAITLGERLTDDTFVVHFEKAFANIQGAYPMVNREFVRHELGAYDFVNREEDLGMEGLRKAKLSYYPECLQEKGSVKESR